MNHLAPKRRLATLTAEEEAAWEKYFFFYVTDRKQDDVEADRKTWRDMQKEFPRLKNFDGAEP